MPIQGDLRLYEIFHPASAILKSNGIFENRQHAFENHLLAVYTKPRIFSNKRKVGQLKSVIDICTKCILRFRPGGFIVFANKQRLVVLVEGRSGISSGCVNPYKSHRPLDRSVRKVGECLPCK